MGYCSIRGEKLSYDQRVESLSDRAHRLLMFAFYGPGRTSLGLRRFRIGDALSFAPAWDEDKAQEAVGELVDSELVMYDQENQLMFLTVQFEHSPLAGIKTLQGAAKKLDEFPDSEVLLPVLEHMFSAASEAFQDGKTKKNATAQAAARVIIESIRNRRERIEKQKAQMNPKNPKSDGPSMDHPGLDSFADGEDATPQHVVVPKYDARKTCPIDGASEFAEFAPPEPEPEPEPPLKSPPKGHPAQAGGGDGRGRSRGRKRDRGKRGEGEYGKFDKH